jgi:hypothetical protein
MLIFSKKDLQLKNSIERNKGLKQSELVSTDDGETQPNPNKFEALEKKLGLNKNEINKMLENDLKQYLKPFPFDIFPEPFQEYIKDLEITLNYPGEYTAAGILVCVAGAIGKKFNSVFKGGFEVFPNLFVVLVGRSGISKSSPLQKALQPLFELEEKYSDEYFMSKNQLQNTADRVELKRKRCITQDITLEALIEMLEENSITLYSDEIMAFFNSMNKYRKGGDLQQYLSLWSAKFSSKDRKGRIGKIIRNPIFNCAGTIQTDVLYKFLTENNSNNGFIERILYATINRKLSQKWNTLESNKSLQVEYTKIINRIIESKTEIDEKEEIIPRQLEFDQAATDFLINWQNNNSSHSENTSNNQLVQLNSKLEIYVLRFSLIISVLDYAHSRKKLLENTKAKLIINEDHARKAIALVEYFRDNAKNIFSLIQEPVHLKKLTKKLNNFHELLPTEFSTKKALEVGKDLGISERNVYYYLKSDYFKQKRQGYYKKRYKEM